MSLVKFDPDEPLRVRFTRKSSNRKTGPIPVTMTSSSTCSDNCSWKRKGCYAMNDFVGLHWAKTPAQGLTWDKFCEEVKKLPEGQIWRHNEAGDLPGVADSIDMGAMADLIMANIGRRGFTYTHKPATKENIRAVRLANKCGFAVNWSADSPEQADELAKLRVGPVTMMVEEDSPRFFKTPEGRRGLVCPAQVGDITCERCKLCAVPTRAAIVGFKPHGNFAKQISRRMRQDRVQLPLFG